MRTSFSATLAVVASTALLIAVPHNARAATTNPSAQAALQKFVQAWASLKSYTCIVDMHEASGTRVQDRVMRISFEKPANTRIDILAGDGRGGAVVWRGGDKVRGHQGGFFSAIKMDLDMHDKRVTTLRGATVAEANWGALYEHLSALRSDSIDVVVLGDTTTVTYVIPDPPGDGNVTKEVLMLGGNSLPIEYDQYVGDQLVTHVTTSGVQLDVDLPLSTWSL